MKKRKKKPKEKPPADLVLAGHGMTGNLIGVLVIPGPRNEKEIAEMTTAKELYPDDFKYHYDAPGDYTPIIESFGTVALRVDDGDYQGDIRILYRDGGRIGYLNFGWGSCSGCDALQACCSHEDCDKLIVELRDSIKWFDSSSEALTFFETHDWRGDYSWHEKGQQKFLADVKAYLSQVSTNPVEG